MQSPFSPPRATQTPPSQPPTPPAVSSSDLLSLRYGVRKFPGDSEMISIHAREIINPGTTVVSYDLLLAVVQKTWPVDYENQELLMNWIFPIFDQESFSRCVIHLFSFGRNMHEIVLCDLVDGKLPDDLFEAQAELRKADEFFWQGGWDAAQVKSRLEFLKKKGYDGRRGATGETAPKKRYPWGVGKWRNTAGAQLHVRPNAPRRQPSPPESVPSANRRNGRPVSTSSARPSGRRQASGTDGAYTMARRFIVPSLLSQPTPGRWRQGGGVAKPIAGDAQRQRLESSDVQKAGCAKDIPTERIRSSDFEGSVTSRTLSAEGHSSEFGCTVVPSQPRFKHQSMEVTAQATQGKQFPMLNVEKCSTTAGKHFRCGPGFNKRRNEPPRNEPPSKRRDGGPASASVSGCPGIHHLSGSDSEDGQAVRSDVQSLTSQVTPGGGASFGPMNAGTSEKTLAREPLPVAAKTQQYRVAADAQFCFASGFTDALVEKVVGETVEKVCQSTSFPRVTDSC